MAGVVLRPDLRTAGGEISDIVYNGRYVGMLALVYREQDRLSGSVQLEKESLPVEDKQTVTAFLTDYVQGLSQALDIVECDVVFTYSACDHVIASREEYELGLEESDQLYEDEPEVIWVHDDDDLGDWDFPERENFRMDPPEESGEEPAYRYGDDPGETEEEARNPDFYELVATKQTDHEVEYHVYDEDQEWVAEVFLRVIGNDIIGDVHWMFDPLDEELDGITNLIVKDFDDAVIDTFTIDHRFEGAIIDTVELAHKELLDEADFAGYVEKPAEEHDEYTVVLARDDRDMLTYDIYNRNQGGLHVGTATVDISLKQLSGFIDFHRNLTEPGVREKIAALVMQELDKEKDYSTISFTMLEHNKPIDEVVFENEPVH